MRRTKMIVAGGAMTAMLALSAGPVMANEVEFSDTDFSGDDVLVVDEGTTTFDDLCSPGLSDGIFIPGCIFSDPLEEDFDDFDEEAIFFVEDFDFDEDDFDEDGFDFNHDDRNDNNRNGNFVG